MYCIREYKEIVRLSLDPWVLVYFYFSSLSAINSIEFIFILLYWVGVPSASWTYGIVILAHSGGNWHISYSSTKIKLSNQWVYLQFLL